MLTRCAVSPQSLEGGPKIRAERTKEARAVSGKSLTMLAAACVCLGNFGCSDDSYRLGGTKEGHEAARIGLCSKGAELELIDSMEDGVPTIDETAGRNGFWFTFNDKTGGTQYPGTIAEKTGFPMAPIVPARAGSEYGIRTDGSGFRLWGSGVGIHIKSQNTYDASRYAGISFWARRGRSMTTTLRFNVPDIETSALGQRCDLAGEKCDDDFGVDLTLSTSFRYFSVTWADMTQANWSHTSLPAIDPAHIYGLRFQTKENEPFDFWVDDVTLLCQPE